MSDKIEPALTPDLWRQLHDAKARGQLLDSYTGDSPDACAYLVAINNDALPDDDPRKITREMIRDIREGAELAHDALRAEYGAREQWGHTPLTLEAMVNRTLAHAAALESYLPPEA